MVGYFAGQLYRRTDFLRLCLKLLPATHIDPRLYRVTYHHNTYARHQSYPECSLYPAGSLWVYVGTDLGTDGHLLARTAWPTAWRERHRLCGGGGWLRSG